MLDRAISIASKALEGKFDKGGKPYILHCLWVMDKVRHLGENYMIVGVLHDLIEDTNWSELGLINEGFDHEVVCAISLLTRKEGDNYEQYIEQIKTNPIAREVKLRDLEHDSKITRLKGLRGKDFERLQKYCKSYNYLK